MTPPENEHPDYAAARDGQREAALPGLSAWVDANAGSGKTKVLIDRVARLLLRRVSPDAILCVTYTKAAASEMQARLFARLGEWCVMDDERLCTELAKLEHRPQAEYDHQDVARARELFAKALETPGGLRIETIHAFAGRILRRFPLEAGLAPGFVELDEHASGDLWQAAFADLGRRVIRGDRALMDAARCAAEAAGGKRFEAVRAILPRRAAIESFVAASGGIEAAIGVLARRFEATGEDPQAILARAMDEDLPRDSITRAISAFETGKKQDFKQAELLRTALSDWPAETRFEALRRVVVTEKGQLKARGSVFTKGLDAAHPILVDLFDVDAPQGSETQRILATDKAVKAERMLARSAALLRLGAVMFEDFASRKRARAGLDFDDLIETASRLLTRTHAAEWVLWKLDGGISHILLDEAQDTSPAQWTILRKLTEDIFAGLGAERAEPRTLFVVGDQKQSIYSFQGADPEYFLSQKSAFGHEARAARIGFALPGLAMSFRSSPQVLDYVDTVFDPAAFAPEAPFTLRAPEDAALMRHKPFRINQPGSVELWPLETKAEVRPTEPWTAPRGAESPSSAKARLATRIARFIRDEIATKAAVWDGNVLRPARPGDFLILVRGRTGGLFDAILQALKRESLPVAGADRIELLNALAVQDLLNLIRFALYPDDDLVLAEILKGPFAGLDDEGLFAIAHQRKGSLWAAVRQAGLPVADFLENVLARRSQAPFEFLTHALERGHGLPRPGWEMILSRFGGPAREPVTALVDRAAAFDAGAAPSLQLFLDAIERRGGEVKRELSGAQDEVRVMTVHGAKGLEAPIVILPDTCSAHRSDRDGVFISDDGAPVWAGAASGDIPLSAALRAEAEARALREHRRLLYVALTRAQDRLILCGAFAGKDNTAGFAKSAWYPLLQRAMTRLLAEGRAQEIADGERTIVRFGAAPSPVASGKSTPAQDTRLPAWLRRPVTLEFRGKVLSPSRLTPASEPPVISPFGDGRAQRLRRGKLIHTLFEALPELAPETRRKAAEAFLLKQADLSPAQRMEMLDAAMGVIGNEAFAALFQPGGRAEAPIVGPLGKNTIYGRVDRLVITESEILVIDYKSDRPSPPTLEGVGEAYIAQMAAYRAVLTQGWPNRPIRCLLVWTDGPKLMEIPPAALDKALSALSL